MADAPLLRGASDPRFYFRCTTCSRKGRYSRESLIKMFGPDAPIPSIPGRLAALRECPYAGNLPLSASIACGIHFDIAAMYLELKRENEARKNWR